MVKKALSQASGKIKRHQMKQEESWRQERESGWLKILEIGNQLRGDRGETI